MASTRVPSRMLAMPLFRPTTSSLVANAGRAGGTPILASSSSSGGAGSRNANNMRLMSTTTNTNTLHMRSRMSPLQTSSLLQQRQQQQQRRTMAKMSLIGRLTAAPELITTLSGHECVRYTIAKGHGKDKYPSFFRVLMFDEGRDREVLLDLPKGSLVYVEATARLRQYTDNDGTLKTSLGLVQRALQVILKHRPVDPKESQEQQSQEQHNARVMGSPGEATGPVKGEYGSISDVDGEGEPDEYGDDGVAPSAQPEPEK